MNAKTININASKPRNIAIIMHASHGLISLDFEVTKLKTISITSSHHVKDLFEVEDGDSGAGSKPRQALLFKLVSEYVSLVAWVDSRTQESQRGRNGLFWFGPIGALRPAADDPYTQEHPKSGGYN